MPPRCTQCGNNAVLKRPKTVSSLLDRSLQKVQGHRTAQGHRTGVNADLTPPTDNNNVPVGHPPIRRPCVTAVRREVYRYTQGHLQNTQT